MCITIHFGQYLTEYINKYINVKLHTTFAIKHYTVYSQYTPDRVLADETFSFWTYEPFSVHYKNFMDYSYTPK